MTPQEEIEKLLQSLQSVNFTLANTDLEYFEKEYQLEI